MKTLKLSDPVQTIDCIITTDTSRTEMCLIQDGDGWHARFFREGNFRGGVRIEDKEGAEPELLVAAALHEKHSREALGDLDQEDQTYHFGRMVGEMLTLGFWAVILSTIMGFAVYGAISLFGG